MPVFGDTTVRLAGPTLPATHLFEGVTRLVCSRQVVGPILECTMLRFDRTIGLPSGAHAPGSSRKWRFRLELSYRVAVVLTSDVAPALDLTVGVDGTSLSAGHTQLLEVSGRRR